MKRKHEQSSSILGISFVNRFKEADFIINDCKFIDPLNRKSKCDSSIIKVVDRFNNGYFNKHEVLRQYRLYRLEEDIDMLFKKNDYSAVKLFCALYQIPEYTEFAKLCLLLFTISPDTCEVERGFSRMNFVKNEFRSTLSNRHLNDLVAVNMDERDLNSFPIEKCL